MFTLLITWDEMSENLKFLGVYRAKLIVPISFECSYVLLININLLQIFLSELNNIRENGVLYDTNGLY